MNNHYVIADLHLGHKRILDLDGRPFQTIEDHDDHQTIACRPKDDLNGELWILGDMAYRAEQVRDFMDAVRPYWGKIHLIRGNHDDRAAWRCRDLFDSAREAFYLRLDKETRVYLSHYAHRTWRGSNNGSYHLHGHSHGALESVPWGRSRDVCTSLIGYKPIWIPDAIRGLADRPLIDHHANFDLAKRGWLKRFFS